MIADVCAMIGQTCDQLGAGVVALSDDGLVIGTNTTLERLFGYQPGELHGQLLDTILPHVPGTLLDHQHDQTALSPTTHLRGVSKDGNGVPVQVAVQLLPLGQQPTRMLIITAYDAPAPLQAKPASDGVNIQVDEEIYRLISERTADIITVIDQQGRIMYASPSYQTMFGLAPAELVGTAVYERVHPDDFAHMNEEWMRAMISGSGTVTLRYRNSADQWRWIEARGQVTVLHDVPYIVLISQDITERKHMQQALADERKLLARRVEERTADLSAANAELARTARLKDEFLASISHELRTPLHVLLGLADALDEGSYGQVNQEQDNALRQLGEHGRHLLAVINDLIDLARLNTGKIILQYDWLPLSQVCESSIHAVQRHADKKQIVLTSAIDEAVSLIWADPQRLVQVLVDLLSNAVKFTPAGGKVGLDVRVEAEQQVATFTVWDSGIGIPHDRFDELFEPFVQLDAQLSRRYQGTGLGLTLVHRLTDLHGGSVGVQSVVDKGSHFVVRMPLGHDPGTTSSRHSPIRRALVIDDSPTAAAYMSLHLQEMGIEVDQHNQSTNAVDQVAALQPDLVLLDVILGDGSGWDVLAALKKDGRTSHVPVVMMSVIEYLPETTTSAAGYLVKPTTREDVKHLIAQLSNHGALFVSTPRHSIEDMSVLLADQSESSILLLTDVLGSLGCRVVVARNGTEAIALAHEVQPAMIVMNQQMPGMDGLEALKRIRTDADLADVPIVMISSLVLPGDEERCLAAGATAYLPKPLSSHDLAPYISAALGK